MFDTNVFNSILDEKLKIIKHTDQEYFITNLQRAEINRTKNKERRENLVSMFLVVTSSTHTTQVNQLSTPWGSPWSSPWSNSGQYYKSILNALESRKPKDRGNSYDAVMIETCKYKEISFVSNDSAVLGVSKEFGVKCISFSDFSRECLGSA